MKQINSSGEFAGFASGKPKAYTTSYHTSVQSKVQERRDIYSFGAGN